MPKSDRNIAPSTFMGWIRAASLGRDAPVPWLLSLLLILQLVGLGAFAHRIASPGAGPFVEIAHLDAIIGHPVPICLHGAPGSPGPATPAHDDHCGVCCLIGASVALVPTGIAFVVPRVRIAQAILPTPFAPVPFKSRHAGGSGPRGPPTRA